MAARLRLLSIALTAICFPQVAAADVIDGDWCSGKGAQSISIQGPTVVTPGGTKMQGIYTRHSFSYTAPAGEPEAGQTVDMQLLNETTVQIRMGDRETPTIWHRCTGTTS